MLKADITTIEGRQKLIKHVIHECYLEGHNVTSDLIELYDQFIAGKMTMEQIKQTYLIIVQKIA